MPSEANVELLTPETMPRSVGYSQVATVTAGKIVFVAGQVALDKSGNVVGKGEFGAQVQQVFENIKAIQRSARQIRQSRASTSQYRRASAQAVPAGVSRGNRGCGRREGRSDVPCRSFDTMTLHPAGHVNRTGRLTVQSDSYPSCALPNDRP
jgi:hypothetical protein